MGLMYSALTQLSSRSTMEIPFIQYVFSEVCETFESWDILYMPGLVQGFLKFVVPLDLAP